MGSLCSTNGFNAVSTETEKDPDIRCLCVRGMVYGSEKEGPFWESEILLEKVRYGGLEMEFFKALALCNECRVIRDSSSGVKVRSIEMDYDEENCVLVAKKEGVELTDFSKSRRVKILKYDEERFPKYGRNSRKEYWAELLVIGENSGRGRTTLALQRVSKKDRPRGDVHVYSHGNRERILEILKEEVIEDPTIEATRKYFEEFVQLEEEEEEEEEEEKETDDKIKKRLSHHLTEYYIAHKIIEKSEWEELEQELEGGGEDETDRLKIFHSEVEEDMILLGCVAIPMEER